MLTLIIRNATIVDGSGNPAYAGDLLVEGERIAGVGHYPAAQADHEIDATGKVLCPGFIDVHTHSELAMLAGQHTAGILMGVTTELIGPDGFCFTPLPPERLAEYRRYLYGIYGDANVGWDWGSFAEYLERFVGQVYNNIVPQAPHGAIRLAVKGWAPGAAFAAELDAMRRLTRECMEAGAVGLNAGLDYAPAAQSDLNELVELSKVVAEYGGVYAAHIRGYDDEAREAAIAETVAISERAGVGVHISHFSGTPEIFASTEAARARGIDITFDSYPYMAGCTFLTFTLPRTFITAPVDQVVEQLQEPRVRQMVAQTLDRKLPPDSPAYFASVNLPHNKWMEGFRVRQAWMDGRPAGQPFEDFVCDLLVEEDLAPVLIYPWGDNLEANEARLRYSLTHPQQMILTDGIYRGRFTHPRGWGTYPRLLGTYVREKGWLSLEDAIRRASGFPALRFGLHDRGLLYQGMVADLVIFDPQTIQDRATYSEPRLSPAGIEQVFVNGVQVVRDGALVPDARPGRVVRRHGG
jgi:N-acyl-D-amino-acid deacylase